MARRRVLTLLVTSLGPIPLATMTNGEWRNVGQNYLKSLLALGFQAFLIMVVVGIYSVLIQSISATGERVRRNLLGNGLYGAAVFLSVQNGQYGKGRVQRPLTEGLPIGTYNIIYADPPWRYEQRKVAGRGRKSLFHHEH